jgi:hypothetical protein
MWVVLLYFFTKVIEPCLRSSNVDCFIITGKLPGLGFTFDFAFCGVVFDFFFGLRSPAG